MAEKPVENFTDADAKTFRDGIQVNKIMKWNGTHVVGDLAVEDQFWGICNTDTTDHVAPQYLGNPPINLVGADMTSESSYEGIVSMQNAVTISRGCCLREIYLWCTNVSAGTYHKVYLSVNSVKTAVALPRLEVGWNLIRAGEYILLDGDFVVLTHEVMGYAAATRIDATWKYSNNNGGAPSTGNWGTNQNAASATVVRISKTDFDGNDLGSDLTAVPVDAFITMKDSQVPANYVTYKVSSTTDAGTYVEYAVSVVGNNSTPRVGYNSLGEISKDAVQTTTFKTLPSGFATLPSFASAAVGRLYYDGSPQYENNTAMGIDMVVQEAFVSADWDYISAPI